LNNIVYLIR